MRITITGVPKKISTKLIREAIRYFAKLLMTERLYKTLNINIKFVKNPGGSKLGIMTGDWAIMDYDSNLQTTWAPKDFRVEIASTINKQKLLEVLAHEMVHVKQYARKEMDYTCHAEKKRWLGKIFDISGVDYWDYPWEIEAFGKEIGMVSRFIKNNHKRLDLKVTQLGHKSK